MTDLMIERAAMALHALDRDWYGTLLWYVLDEEERSAYVDMAHAALSTLLPPDPEAVRRVAYETDIDAATVEAIWRRMVELAGPPPESSGP